MHVTRTVFCIFLLLPISDFSEAKEIALSRLPGTLSDAWPRVQPPVQAATFNWPARHAQKAAVKNQQKTELSKKERHHLVSAHLALLLR